jgi:hypothetical protein
MAVGVLKDRVVKSRIIALLGPQCGPTRESSLIILMNMIPTK